MTLPSLSGLKTLAWRSHKALETREHRLLYLFFEVTRRCNLACAHCGSDCGRAPAMRELSLETWLSAAAYVKAAWDPFIVITGGEPLVREDLGELTAGLARQGLRWGMVTNGLALDQARFDALVSNGLESMTVSLDGTREGHLLLRRNPASFDKALVALDILGSSGLRWKDAVTCVFPANLEDLDAVAELLIERRIRSWRLFRIFPKGSADRHPELHLDFAQSRALLEWIASRRPRLAARGLDLSFSCEGYLPFALDRRVRDEPFFCRAGINIASILCDGTITGCNNNAPAFIQGSLETDDLARVWEERFRAFRDRGWMRKGACATCGDWRDCLGSSLHLRDAPGEGPRFCYLHDLSRPGADATS